MESGAYIVYDGECPFCSRYVAFLRLQDAVGPVQLIDARQGGPLVQALRSQGYSLDEGMAFILGGTVYHGADCIYRLALLSSDSTWFNRLSGLIFRNRRVSNILYPILRAGRNAALKILQRDLMGDSRQEHAAGRFGFHRYRRYAAALFVSLAVYAGIAESARLPYLRRIPHPVGDEFFPFFNWSLFSTPWRYNHRYTIVPVAVVPGSPLKDAVGRALQIQEAPFLRDIRFHKTASLLHRRLRAGNEAKVREASALIDNFVKPLGIESYQLVWLKFDSLIRKGNNVLGEENVYEFDSSSLTRK